VCVVWSSQAPATSGRRCSTWTCSGGASRSCGSAHQRYGTRGSGWSTRLNRFYWRPAGRRVRPWITASPLPRCVTSVGSRGGGCGEGSRDEPRHPLPLRPRSYYDPAREQGALYTRLASPGSASSGTPVQSSRNKALKPGEVVPQSAHAATRDAVAGARLRAPPCAPPHLRNPHHQARGLRTGRPDAARAPAARGLWAGDPLPRAPHGETVLTSRPLGSPRSARLSGSAYRALRGQGVLRQEVFSRRRKRTESRRWPPTRTPWRSTRLRLAPCMPAAGAARLVPVHERESRTSTTSATPLTRA
jgi:hypothetical protein